MNSAKTLHDAPYLVVSDFKPIYTKQDKQYCRFPLLYNKMSNIAKISVEKFDNKDEFLYDLDKNKNLCEVVKDICRTAGLPESPVYGLKLIQTKENPFINTYISEKTYKNIQHSDCLKIVFSIEYLLNKRILPHIDEEEGSLERAICFDDLLKLSVDSVFIDEIARNNSHIKLIDIYINNNQLKENEQLALLITITHLLQKKLCQGHFPKHFGQNYKHY
ncbi:hypothetical protein NQ317_016794 [Molorchus minor]|uniref:Uncharacterized protein n=1 Tax=Molorchus minor TaxID=1323400 RepID=A0ABQ9J2Z3_9CUCU|nr:hypothetical protein NQ317_016794 [Molorchus minor]